MKYVKWEIQNRGVDTTTGVSMSLQQGENCNWEIQRVHCEKIDQILSWEYWDWDWKKERAAPKVCKRDKRKWGKTKPIHLETTKQDRKNQSDVIYKIFTSQALSSFPDVPSTSLQALASYLAQPLLNRLIAVHSN